MELLHFYDAEVLPWGRNVRGVPPANYYRAWMLRRGEGRVRIGSRWHGFGAGDWMVPSPTLNGQEFSGDARLFSVHFRARWPDGRPLFDFGPRVTWKSADHPALLAAADALHDSCAIRTPALYGEPVLPESQTLDQFLALHNAFREWLRVFCACMAAHGAKTTEQGLIDERVLQGLQWLDRLPLGSKFREPMLAERLGLSVIHMNRLFMREIKITPAAYLERRRWERASYLLFNTAHSAKEVAYELGFCAPSYFATWVKKRSGKTPLQFRRRAP